MSKLLRGHTICVLLIVVTFVGVSIGFGKKHKTKKGKEIPVGQAVLWRDPADIHRRNLLLGPGGESMRPDLRQVTLIEKEKGWLLYEVSRARRCRSRVGCQGR
jgi:hypothetical protein